MRHDDHPHAVAASPALQLGEHGLDGLRLGGGGAGLYFEEQVWVDDQVLQGHDAPHLVGTVKDVLGCGRHFVQVEVHHVGVQVVEDGL